MPSRSQDDVIFKTIPGFVLELPLGRHKIDLGFRAEILRYVDLESQDTEHYFVIGNLLLDFPGGLKFKLKEDFARTSDPPGTELTGRIKSTTNVLSPGVEYGLGRRYAIGLDYTWANIRFDDVVNQLDRDEHTVGLTGFYRIQPKTDLLVNFSYGVKDFDQASDRDVNRYIGAVGVRGEITSKLSSTLRLGYEVRDPDHGRGRRLQRPRRERRPRLHGPPSARASRWWPSARSRNRCSPPTSPTWPIWSRCRPSTS